MWSTVTCNPQHNFTQMSLDKQTYKHRLGSQTFIKNQLRQSRSLSHAKQPPGVATMQRCQASANGARRFRLWSICRRTFCIILLNPICNGLPSCISSTSGCTIRGCALHDTTHTSGLASPISYTSAPPSNAIEQREWGDR